MVGSLNTNIEFVFISVSWLAVDLHEKIIHAQRGNEFKLGDPPLSLFSKGVQNRYRPLLLWDVDAICDVIKKERFFTIILFDVHIEV